MASIDDDSISLETEDTEWLCPRLYHDRLGVDVPGVVYPDWKGDDGGELAAVETPLSGRLPELRFRP